MRQDAALEIFHLLGLRFVFVIIAQEMKNAVGDQMPGVIAQALALRRGFLGATGLLLRLIAAAYFWRASSWQFEGGKNTASGASGMSC